MKCEFSSRIHNEVSIETSSKNGVFRNPPLIKFLNAQYDAELVFILVLPYLKMKIIKYGS
jgi:hypothetical protein